MATIGKENEIWISAESVRDLAEGEPARTALATRAVFGSLSPPTERAFASTYREDQTPSGYRYLQLYKQVIERDESRSKIAQQVPSLRESTIQSWRRGSKPYVRNGIETARELGWITPQTESDTALALTSLVAWVHARGTIRETYYPVFRISSQEHQSHFENVADDLDFEYNIIRDDDPNRPTEARISENGTALGRGLHILGVPLNDSKMEERVPPVYLYHHTSHARQFVTTWCVHYADGDEELIITVPLRLEERFTDGLEDLLTKQLFWSTTRIGERKLEVIPNDNG